jgi:hypothetical protein
VTQTKVLFWVDFHMLMGKKTHAKGPRILMIGFLNRKKPLVWNGLITIRKINDLPSMQPKMIALNPWMSCAFPSSFSFTFLFHCKRMFVSTSTYILTFLTKALN